MANKIRQQSIKGNVQSLQSTLEESKSIISSYIKFDLLNLAAEELNVYTKVEGNYLSSLSNEQAVAMLLNMLAVNNAQNQFLEALRHSVTLSSYPDKSHLDSHAFLVEDLEERLKVKPKKNKKRKDRKNSLSVEVKLPGFRWYNQQDAFSGSGENNQLDKLQLDATHEDQGLRSSRRVLPIKYILRHSKSEDEVFKELTVPYFPEHEALASATDYLRTKIPIELILPSLRAHNVVNDAEESILKNEAKSKVDKSERLLEMLRKKDPKFTHKFCDLLQGYDSESDSYGYLATYIEDKIQKFEEDMYSYHLQRRRWHSEKCSSSRRHESQTYRFRYYSEGTKSNRASKKKAIARDSKDPMEPDLETATFDSVPSVDSKTKDQKSRELEIDRTTDNACPQHLQELNQLKHTVQELKDENARLLKGMDHLQETIKELKTDHQMHEEEISELKRRHLSAEDLKTENALLKVMLSLEKKMHHLEESVTDLKAENQLLKMKISAPDSGKLASTQLREDNQILKRTLLNMYDKESTC